MNFNPDTISKEKLIEKIDDDMDQTIIVYAILICATLMASIGLNYNSTTTVIGAMLISPLMSGISGIGFGIGLPQIDMAKRGMLIFLLQFIIILGISFFFFFMTPVKEPTPEITARTSATVWDILIALLGGFALAFSKTRAKDNNVVIGVSIATSLILPLCVTGYGLSVVDFTIAWNSVKLFLLNVFLICLAIVITTWILNYHESRKTLSFLILLPLMLIGIALLYATISTTILEYRTKKFCENELSAYYVIEQNIDKTSKKINLVLAGKKMPMREKEILSKKLKKYDLGEYGFTFAFYSDNEDGAIDAETLAKILAEENKGKSKFLGIE